MPPESGLITVVVMLLSLPFVLAHELWRFLVWLNRWRLHRAGLPPALLNRSRAVTAVFAMAFSIDVGRQLPVLIGTSFAELVAIFLRSHELSPVLGALLAILALSLLFLIVGVRGGHGAPRDPIAALMALSVAGAAAYLLWRQWHMPADLAGPIAARDTDALLHALEVAVLSAALLRAWLSAPLLTGDALRRILRHIEHRTGRLRPARRRSY